MSQRSKYYFLALSYMCIFLFYYFNLYGILFKIHPTKENLLVFTTSVPHYNTNPSF